MKTIALAPFAAGALTAALGLAGTAAAFPGDGSAEDTVSGRLSTAEKRNTIVLVDISCPSH